MPITLNGTTGITTDSGSVGIGTTSPQQNLDVRGRIQVSNGSAGGQLGVDGGGLSISANGAGPITFAANAFTTNLARIATDGSQSSVIPGGSTLYPEFKCRAWVNFNGTGTVAIRASGNVSSITDNGVGDYTVNFATAMPDANYSFTQSGKRMGDASSGHYLCLGSTAPTSSALRIEAHNQAGTILDSDFCNVAIFR